MLTQAIGMDLQAVGAPTKDVSVAEQAAAPPAQAEMIAAGAEVPAGQVAVCP